MSLFRNPDRRQRIKLHKAGAICVVVGLFWDSSVQWGPHAAWFKWATFALGGLAFVAALACYVSVWTARDDERAPKHGSERA
jgi:hypothetical protein